MLGLIGSVGTAAPVNFGLCCGHALFHAHFLLRFLCRLWRLFALISKSKLFPRLFPVKVNITVKPDCIWPAALAGLACWGGLPLPHCPLNGSVLPRRSADLMLSGGLLYSACFGCAVRPLQPVFRRQCRLALLLLLVVIWL